MQYPVQQQDHPRPSLCFVLVCDDQDATPLTWLTSVILEWMKLNNKYGCILFLYIIYEKYVRISKN